MLSERYELIRPIGAGGMGVVYLAHDKKLNKKWAVKEIRMCGEYLPYADERKSAVNAELWALKCLDHRNLPRIVDVVWERGSAFLVMDFVEGENLKDMSERLGGLKQSQVVNFGIELADTLCYLHSCAEPVIYRDMKPSNVIVKSDGSIRLVDLGASRMLGNIAECRSEGTRRYAAPEQLNGYADERSDIYSLGKTLEAVLRGKICSRRLMGILKKCMEPDPERRYCSAYEVKCALERIGDGSGRHKVMAAIGGLLMICALVLIFFGRGPGSDLGKVESTYVADIGGDGTGKRDEEGQNFDTVARIRQEEARKLLVEENYSLVSLGKALLLLEEAHELIGEDREYDENRRREIMECRIENLSMLSTIYKLLGQKDSSGRVQYYSKAEKYIEELFAIDSVKDTSLYRIKLLDLVGMKQETGETEEAIRMLREWEHDNPEEGKELYFAHITILLKTPGNASEVRELYGQMQKIQEVTEDFRYKDVSNRILKYLGE